VFCGRFTEGSAPRFRKLAGCQPSLVASTVWDCATKTFVDIRARLDAFSGRPTNLRRTMCPDLCDVSLRAEAVVSGQIRPPYPLLRPATTFPSRSSAPQTRSIFKLGKVSTRALTPHNVPRYLRDVSARIEGCSHRPNPTPVSFASANNYKLARTQSVYLLVQLNSIGARREFRFAGYDTRCAPFSGCRSLRIVVVVGDQNPTPVSFPATSHKLEAVRRLPAAYSCVPIRRTAPPKRAPFFPGGAAYEPKMQSTTQIRPPCSSGR